MLKLKKLQMQGFKSFCERTEMSFPGVGVVAIVGPNGCGKSNVADAIGWVLGEQSAKSLRGGRMEDVIFAGTSERAPMGMAEVSLTLTDPAAYEPVADEPEADPAPLAADQGWDDEAAPAPASPEGDAGAPATAAGGVVLTIRERRKARQHNRRGEIVVTRRLFRSGESEYLMNGRLCRLRDIQELFMGTGLGPESYAIIEQGRIGQILSSKPHERRAVIEEAAGVSRYKAKRRQAEARLEAARLNLNRINDIFEEVTRQVGSLKRQAAKAQRWRELKQELDARQRDWLRVQAAAALAEAAALQQQRDEARQTLAQAEQYLRGLEQERAAQLADCASRELDLRRAGERTVGLQRAQDQAEQQLRYGNEQEAELLRRDQALEQQQREAGGQTAGLAEELTAAAAAHANAGALVAEAAARQQAQREVRQSAAAVLGRLAAELDQARSQQMTALAAAAQAANQRTQAEAARQAAADRLERAQREAAESAAELQAGGAECGQLRLQLESDGGQQSALARQVEELAARGQELARAESAARGAVEQ
ncbi:MAG: AAA family ATPase, partial [Terriglobales bacterium]